ncbi:hypothetical protein BGX26_003158 [Mortierella sp. AD094]|nr:hypothetical protein BGX26_003158 [Mortierella sp. AD094]
MSFPKDKKGELPQAFDAEDERKTFGQQSPYATPTLAAQSIEPTVPTAPVASSSSAPATPPQPQPSTPSASPIEQPSTPQTLPQSRNEHSYNPQGGHVAMEVPPPAYEEVAQHRQPRLPQQHYRPEEDNNTDPSAPLLGRTPAADYSSIPVSSNIPIARAADSHPPSISGSSTSEDSQRSRRFNKFWFWFIVVIIVLLILDRGEIEGSGGKCANQVSKTMTELQLAPDYTDFTVAMTNMPSYIIVDQRISNEDEGIMITATATAFDREDLQNIRHEIVHDQYLGTIKLTYNRESSKAEPKCLKTTFTITFPPSMKKINRLKLMVNEGNVTVNLLEPNKTLSLQYLESTVITGHNYIKADVGNYIKVGGTVGTLRGEIAVRRDFSANLIDGDVSLNLIQSPGVLVSSKISVVNGNVNVGMAEN